MELRPLTAELVGPVVDQLWRPFAEEMADLDEYNELDPEEDLHKLASEFRHEQLGDDDARTLVAVVDGEPVGYVHGRVESSPPVFARGAELFVNEVYVAPDHRRAGIGRALLDEIEAWGRERDADTAALSVNVRNERARACYRDRGYEKRRLKLTKEL